MRKGKDDFRLLDIAIETLEQRLNDLKEQPHDLSDEYFFELVLECYRKMRTAKDEGKYLIAHSVQVPVEIMYAMDLVPMQMEHFCGVTALSNAYDEIFSASKAFGWAPEICTFHRVINGHILLNTMPRPDAVIWSSQCCDNTAKAGDPFMELFGCPGYFMDRPYRFTELDQNYLAEDLKGMVRFLENLTDRKMDWDRLGELVGVTQKMIEATREIYELRKATPAPMKSRRFRQMGLLTGGQFGNPSALKFFLQFRDEIKHNVDQGKGSIPETNYRLMQLFTPPDSIGIPLMNWMEEEHGAVSVIEPYFSTWGPGDLDPNDPLQSLALKCFIQPVCRQMNGPVSEGVLEDTLEAARFFKPDGAIFWAHIGCRESCACIKMLKDELAEKFDIPMLVVDNDYNDFTYVSMDQIKDKLEGFFEILDDRE